MTGVGSPFPSWWQHFNKREVCGICGGTVIRINGVPECVACGKRNPPAAKVSDCGQA